MLERIISISEKQYIPQQETDQVIEIEKTSFQIVPIIEKLKSRINQIVRKERPFIIRCTWINKGVTTEWKEMATMVDTVGAINKREIQKYELLSQEEIYK